MAVIVLKNFSVDFPIYQGGSRMLKHTLLRASTGGFISGKEGSNVKIVEALHDVSLTINKHDRLGLIGCNGAGKTTLLRALAGVYEPTAGSIEVEGKVTPVFDIGLGIDQDATGHENIIIRGMFLGIPRKKILEYMEEIAAFTELGEYLHMPVRTYSSGMMVRLCFSVSTCIIPEILLMDEWILAGDAKFISKASTRLENMVSHSKVLVLASHSNELIRQWCNKVVWMDKGRLKAYGPTEEILDIYEKSI